MKVSKIDLIYGIHAVRSILQRQPDRLLDGIRGRQDLGACRRTCDAAAVRGIVISHDRSVSVTRTVRKVSCGASETVPVIEVGNLARALDRLKEKGVWVMGTADNAPQ